APAGCARRVRWCRALGPRGGCLGAARLCFGPMAWRRFPTVAGQAAVRTPPATRKKATMSTTSDLLWETDERLRQAGDGEEPTLKGIHLSRSFGQGETMAHALKDVTLELYGGQIALLMGPSGSGKSTLLAVLSGLLRPDSGKVLALGVDLWGLPERQQEEFRLRHCGFIFQGYNLFPALTARQQLEMVLRWGQGASRREARR